MAATPPLQITQSPHSPPTPLHGAAYDYEDSPRRFSARLRQKRALEGPSEESAPRNTRLTKTPNSPRNLNLIPQSPNRTPQRKTAGRRVQVLSPPSPDFDTAAPKPLHSNPNLLQPLLSTTTTLNEGMLPTPVKTPNKKHKMVKNSNVAARALFQDPLAPDESILSPRKNRKTKRYNGFSLESFRAEDGRNGQVQIFTDSRDQVPEIDVNDDNPFLNSDRHDHATQKMAGTTKRRKISGARKLDPQVEEALEKDEGMVYTFRGKKVYRRFDDNGEEEEEIDVDDLGLLRHTAEGATIVKPLKTLTRKSVRPTRLFQTEQQKRARELEKEEEAATDVGESEDSPEIESRAEDAIRAARGKGKAPANRAVDSQGSLELKKGSKKASPFDKWARVKPGSASSSGASKPSRSRKRAASGSPEESLTTKA